MMESPARIAIRKDSPGSIDPLRYQIHVHECPTCATATVQTPQGEQVLSEAEQDAAHCDAQVHDPGHRNKSDIPPRTRREVLARDRHQCRRKGCRHTRHLHMHHIVPRAREAAPMIRKTWSRFVRPVMICGIDRVVTCAVLLTEVSDDQTSRVIRKTPCLANPCSEVSKAPIWGVISSL